MSLRVRAPATTANLGPGFDCAAAALDLWNELYVEERANGGPWVEVTGEGSDELPRDETNVVLRGSSSEPSPVTSTHRSEEHTSELQSR